LPFSIVQRGVSPRSAPHSYISSSTHLYYSRRSSIDISFIVALLYAPTSPQWVLLIVLMSTDSSRFIDSWACIALYWKQNIVLCDIFVCLAWVRRFHYLFWLSSPHHIVSPRRRIREVLIACGGWHNCVLLCLQCLILDIDIIWAWQHGVCSPLISCTKLAVQRKQMIMQ
jgi:hypothetical protein